MKKKKGDRPESGNENATESSLGGEGAQIAREFLSFFDQMREPLKKENKISACFLEDVCTLDKKLNFRIGVFLGKATKPFVHRAVKRLFLEYFFEGLAEWLRGFLGNKRERLGKRISGTKGLREASKKRRQCLLGVEFFV